MFNTSPLSVRRGIPFYTQKSEMAFRNDPYERFRESVMRQLALHYADQYWGAYPFQAVVDWISQQMPTSKNLSFLDIGCSVGRLLKEVSLLRPSWDLFGIDYSYNALRTCHQLLQLGQSIEIDYRERGLPVLAIREEKIPQLQLGLSKAEMLPIADGSINVIVSSFLIDRLKQPAAAVREWYRILPPGGRLLFISPFNWQNAHLWEQYSTTEVARNMLFQNDLWHLLDQTQISIREPLDKSGNFVHWNSSLWSFSKKG